MGDLWKGCLGGVMHSRSSTPSIQSLESTRAYTMLFGVTCSKHHCLIIHTVSRFQPHQATSATH